MFVRRSFGDLNPSPLPRLRCAGHRHRCSISHRCSTVKISQCHHIRFLNAVLVVWMTSSPRCVIIGALVVSVSGVERNGHVIIAVLKQFNCMPCKNFGRFVSLGTVRRMAMMPAWKVKLMKLNCVLLYLWLLLVVHLLSPLFRSWGTFRVIQFAFSLILAAVTPLSALHWLLSCKVS